MPAKNSIKQYLEGGYYHIYNRGVEKRPIFLDEQDYTTFLNLLKKYLDPTIGSDPKQKVSPIASEIDLIAFCLMSNHFHLQVKQHTKYGITKLMRAVWGSYVNYFNKKYARDGSLCQGKYKAVLVQNDIQLLHLSRYIHLNPTKLGSDPKTYSYSSYQYYLGIKKAPWVKTAEILAHFKSGPNRHKGDLFSYQSFVEDYQQDSAEILGELTIEE